MVEFLLEAIHETNIYQFHEKNQLFSFFAKLKIFRLNFLQSFLKWHFSYLFHLRSNQNAFGLVWEILNHSKISRLAMNLSRNFFVLHQNHPVKRKKTPRILDSDREFKYIFFANWIELTLKFHRLNVCIRYTTSI